MNNGLADTFSEYCDQQCWVATFIAWWAARVFSPDCGWSGVRSQAAARLDPTIHQPSHLGSWSRQEGLHNLVIIEIIPTIPCQLAGAFLLLPLPYVYCTSIAVVGHVKIQSFHTFVAFYNSLIEWMASMFYSLVDSIPWVEWGDGEKLLGGRLWLWFGGGIYPSPVSSRALARKYPCWWCWRRGGVEGGGEVTAPGYEEIITRSAPTLRLHKRS